MDRLRGMTRSAATHPPSVALAVVAVVAVAVAVGWFVTNRDEPIRGDRAQLTEALGGSTAADGAKPGKAGGTGHPQLDAAAAQLQALAQRGRGQTFEARYAGTTPAAAQTTLHVWRSPAGSRHDVQQGPGVQSRVLATDRDVVSCLRQGDAAWVCTTQPHITAAAADALAVPSTDQLAGRSITARDDTVAGHQVRCFVFEGADPSSELCLGNDGIVMRVVSASSRLELLELIRGPVAAGVFDLPARPVS